MEGSVWMGSLLMLLLGSSYSISAWNADLKDQIHLNHAQITLVSSMSSLGMYLTPPSGALYDFLGVRLSILLFGVVYSSLYLFLALATVSTSIPFFLQALAFGAIGQAGSLGVCAILGSNEGLRGNGHRGRIIGTLMASFSLGGALYSVLYAHCFAPNVSMYFAFLSVQAIVFCVGGALFLQPSMYAGEGYYQQLLLNPLPNVTGWALLSETRFWYLFTTLFFGVGSALFVMTNISFMVQSMDGHRAAIPIYVMLFSLCNMSSRWILGKASDHWQSRSLFLRGAMVLQALAQFLFVVVPSSLLVVPIALSGVAEGGLFALFPTMIRELFGAVHYGKNFGWISLANAIAYPLVLQPLSALIYHHYAQGTTCEGNMCFEPMFMLTTIGCMVGIWSSLHL